MNDLRERERSSKDFYDLAVEVTQSHLPHSICLKRVTKSGPHKGRGISFPLLRGRVSENMLGKNWERKKKNRRGYEWEKLVEEK